MNIRTVDEETIVSEVRRLCIESNITLPTSHLCALRRAKASEPSALGREVIEQLLENSKIAEAARVPFCQDTGTAVVYLDIGSEVHIETQDLTAAINEGVRRGYEEGFLRKCIDRGPLQRENTGDNTPAIVYYNHVPGDKVKITVLVKGGGCDNMSALTMLTPAEDEKDVIQFVVDVIEKAGPSASPPVTIGVGIGGTFEYAAYMSKRALTRETGESNPEPYLAELEQKILDAVNSTGIGPAGYGGVTTALAVNLESWPTHDSSFPVAVNLDCHSHRHMNVEI